MSIVDAGGLVRTLDALDENFFHGDQLSKDQKVKTAGWIASQQGSANQYLGFAPSESDLAQGIRLFSGEKLRTKIASFGVVSIEACRMLLLLGVNTPVVIDAIEHTNRRLRNVCYANGCILGECAHASVAVGRYLAVGGLENRGQRLEEFLQRLSANRDGTGRWMRFPFYYTLLALTEIDHPSAAEERQYAAPVCERYLKRKPKDGRYDQRRCTIMKRVLAKS
ncbi:MAG: hypothetical protein MUO76_01935 [Anaerolineaceae bacterium]|nr:hypothetical protein [Anaerolineaceae bacterium]